MQQKLVGKVLDRFASEGFEMVACKLLTLTDALLNEHYAHLSDLPFFPEIKAFMSSRPVLAVVLQGDNVIERVRALLGPTDSAAAPAGTLRGDYGTDKMRNIAHASDSPAAAAKEIERFFVSSEIFTLKRESI